MASEIKTPSLVNEVNLVDAIREQTQAINQNTAALRVLIESDPRAWDLPTKLLADATGKSTSTICRKKKRRSNTPPEQRARPSSMANLRAARQGGRP